MNYEIVKLEPKTVAGLMARTNNTAPDMGQVIGGLWQRFYANGIHAQIPNKKSELNKNKTNINFFIQRNFPFIPTLPNVITIYQMLS